MYDIHPLILRPSNPYGPRQGHHMAQGVISTFLRQIKKNETITVYGDGNSTKDYIYIKDLIKQCYELSISSEVGAFNIGSGVGTTVNQIIELIKKITKSNFNTQYEESKIYDVNHFVLDVSKANDIIGTYQTISLDDGISEVWKWIKTNE